MNRNWRKREVYWQGGWEAVEEVEEAEEVDGRIEVEGEERKR